MQRLAKVFEYALVGILTLLSVPFAIVTYTLLAIISLINGEDVDYGNND